MRRIILACALAGILGVPAFGQGVDPMIGTWKLNVEKSTFVGAPAPKSWTITFTQLPGEGQNLAATLDYLDAQGRSGKFVYTMIIDGQPHPTTGSPNYDASAFIRFGNTINQVDFKNGKAVSAGQARFESGNTYTFTSEGNYAGQPQRRVLVWERQ
jgi:hypothetical protein